MKTARHFLFITRILVCVLVVSFVMYGCNSQQDDGYSPEDATGFHTGLLGGKTAELSYYDRFGTELGTLIRGTEVEYRETKENRLEIRIGLITGFLQEGAYITNDPTAVVPEQTLYVRFSVNLRDENGSSLALAAEKGDAVKVLGCDYVDAKGNAHMYRVTLDGDEGYIVPWYLVDSQKEAYSGYDDDYYQAILGYGSVYDDFDAIADGDFAVEDLEALVALTRDVADTDWFYSAFSTFTETIEPQLEELGEYAPSLLDALRQLTELPQESFAQCYIGVADWVSYASEAGLLQAMKDGSLNATHITESNIVQKTLEIQETMPEEFPFFNLVTQFLFDYMFGTK